MNSYIFGTHAVLAVLAYQSKRAVKLIVQEGRSFETQVKIARETWPKARFKDQFGADAVHQGVALQVREFPYVDFDEAVEKRPTLAVVLDSIEDPRNLGRAARSAFALGAELLVIPKDRSAEVTATAEKAAVGCLARIPVARVTNLNRALDDLKKAGLWVLGTSDKASKLAWSVDMKGPTALVIGNEEKGLRKGVADSCDELIQIPMQSSDMSLNAADALTVLLYEVLRQRRV